MGVDQSVPLACNKMVDTLITAMEETYFRYVFGISWLKCLTSSLGACLFPKGVAGRDEQKSFFVPGHLCDSHRHTEAFFVARAGAGCRGVDGERKRAGQGWEEATDFLRLVESDLEPGGSDALRDPSPFFNPGGGTAEMVTGKAIP